MAQHVDIGHSLARVRDTWDGRVGIPREPGDEAFDNLDEGRYAKPVEVATAHLSELAQVIRDGVEGRISTSAMLARLHDRFGGVVDALATWDPAWDNKCADLENALTLATPWNADDRLWTLLASLLPNSRTISLGLALIILSRRIEVNIPDETPIYEREMLEDLRKFERERDWGRLMDMSGRFPTASPDPPEGVAVQGLHVLDRPRLIAVANQMDRWMRAAAFIEPLSMGDAIRIATASKSDAVRFAVLERAMHREDGPWKPADNVALRDMFIILASGSDWPKWLHAINRYPVRCRQFLPALGRALARMNAESLSQYVSSLDLQSSDEEARKLVARCLAEFRVHANLSRRQHLWKAAFERWTQWDFGKNKGERLTSVGRSALDFAVLGHLIEGEGRSLVTNAEHRFEGELREHEIQWHPSISEAIAGFNRMLSRYQLFAAAQKAIGRGEIWGLDDEICYPAAASELIRARYKVQ